MTVEECVALISNSKVPAVCIGDTSTWLTDLQAFFIILSSIAVIATAIFAWVQVCRLKEQIEAARSGVVHQIDAARDTQRLANTLTLLIQAQTNPQWTENRKKFVTIRDSKEGLKKHAKEDSDEAFAIRSVLNQYELISIGISHGILDKTMFKNYYRGTVVRDWLAATQFVSEEREDNDRFWIELQHLAEQFQHEG